MQVNQFPDKAAFVKLAENHNVIPVVSEILADTETPVSALAKLRHARHGTPLFLLESVEGGEHWGRFSFLGASARCEVKLLPDGWTVVTKDHSLSAQWEHTILVTADGHEILTQLPGDAP